MLNYTKNFCFASDLLKWGCVLYGSASHMPSNMVIVAILFLDTGADLVNIDKSWNGKL